MWGRKITGHHDYGDAFSGEFWLSRGQKADPCGTPITNLAKVKFPNFVAVRTILGSNPADMEVRGRS